jgi:hypothetical protein
MLTEFHFYLELDLVNTATNDTDLRFGNPAAVGLPLSIANALLWPLRDLYATVTGDSCRERITVKVKYNRKNGLAPGSKQIERDATLTFKKEGLVAYAHSWSTVDRVMAYILEFLFLPLLLVGTLIGLTIRCFSTPQQQLRAAWKVISEVPGNQEDKNKAIRACTAYFFPDATLNKLALMVHKPDVSVSMVHRI